MRTGGGEITVYYRIGDVLNSRRVKRHRRIFFLKSTRTRCKEPGLKWYYFNIFQLFCVYFTIVLSRFGENFRIIRIPLPYCKVLKVIKRKSINKIKIQQENYFLDTRSLLLLILYTMYIV